MITLRPLTPENARAVVALEVAPAQRRFVATTAESVAQAYVHPTAWPRAIYADETLVGFLMLEVPPSGTDVGLWRLSIAAPFQGRGHGAAAVRAVITHAASLPGRTRLLLSHVPAPGDPGPFYEKLGFRYTGEVEDGERVMALALPAPPPDSRAQRVRDALTRRLGSVVVVAESVRRRHNVSAILRSCESFGIHEVHLVTAGFQPVAGASRSSERWVDTRIHPTTEGSLDDLKARGFRVYVADFLPGAYTPETLPVDAPLALVFGSEVRGVSAAARARADGAVVIPMRGLTHSLNVSVSAAILIRAVAERRRALGGPDLDPAEQARFFAEWEALEAEAERGRRARVGPDAPID